MRNYERTFSLSKLFVMLFVVLTFFACPQSHNNNNNNPNPNQSSGISEITGSETANEKLKDTAWTHSEDMGGGVEIELSRLEFDSETNLCKVRVLTNDFTLYIGEYSIKDDKITLNMEKNILVFKNYTGEQMLKDGKTDFEEAIKELEREIADPSTPEEAKTTLKKTLDSMKKAVEYGMFTSIEKFKKLMLEIIIPAQIEQLETMLKDTNLPDIVKADMQNELNTLKAMQKDPSLITKEFNERIKKIKEKANHLTEINPIVLTIPQGKTLETTTMMTANKIYLGINEDGTPQYKEDVELTKR